MESITYELKQYNLMVHVVKSVNTYTIKGLHKKCFTIICNKELLCCDKTWDFKAMHIADYDTFSIRHPDVNIEIVKSLAMRISPNDSFIKSYNIPKSVQNENEICKIGKKINGQTFTLEFNGDTLEYMVAYDEETKAIRLLLCYINDISFNLLMLYNYKYITHFHKRPIFFMFPIKYTKVFPDIFKAQFNLELKDVADFLYSH